MFPVWFFMVLMFGIIYLLYVTRTTEDTLYMISKNKIKNLQFWLRNSPLKLRR